MSVQPEIGDISELHSAILDAINRGHVYAADVLDYCGPRLGQQERGMDSAAYLREIDRLIDRGYVEREGERFNDQIKLRLTEQGQEAAPALSETDQELHDDHGITLRALRILEHVIEYESREGSLPTISQLQASDDLEASSYQYTLQFNKLVEAGLATEKGIFRYRIVPTDAGRALVDEYSDEL